MNRKLLLRISLLANAGLVALTALVAARPNPSAFAIAQHPGFREYAAKHRRPTTNQPHGFHHFCSEPHDEQLSTLAAFVEAKLDLSADQTDLLSQLMETLKTSAVAAFQPVCTELPTDSLSAPERLVQLQTVVDASSTAIAQVRPAFDTFYASLTEAQQQELNRSIAQWHDRRHGGLE